MTPKSHGTLATAGHIRRNPMLTTREQLHQLLDSLPDAELKAAKRALEKIAREKNLDHILDNAPVDDHEITPEERDDIIDASAALAAGKAVSTNEVRHRFGLPPLETP
jgi:hypothetical protein